MTPSAQYSVTMQLVKPALGVQSLVLFLQNNSKLAKC